MSQHPSLNAMLICDLTIREHGSGKMSLIGIFENISAPRFPTVHRTMSVYAKLTDAAGDYTIGLQLVRVDDGAVTAQGELKVELADRLGAAELVFNLENLTFERPGRYEFRLNANGRWVGSKAFTVAEITAPAS